jgi:hypothetical protein
MKIDFFKLIPKLLGLAKKAVQYSGGGYTPDEIKDLAADLIDIAAELIQSIEKK